MDPPPYNQHRYVERPPNFLHHLPPPLPPPPHISHRPPPQSQFSFENPQFFDYPSPPRVSSTLTLDYPPSTFPYHHHHHNPRSPPPTRFIVDDFILNPPNQEQQVWIRRDVDLHVDDVDERYRRRMDIDAFPSRHRNYDDRYDGERWEYGDVDDALFASSSSRHGYDVSFTNRSTVDKEKKSAFLRIQSGKLSNRTSRNQDNNDFNSASASAAGVRGKHQKDVFDRLERRGTTEASPMELNVSFKSNSLVAKAIDTSEIPRGNKIRKLNLSSSPLNRIGQGESLSNGSNRPLLSSVIVSGSYNSMLSSNGLTGAREIKESSKMMALKQSDNQVGKDETATCKSRKNRKKKKVTTTNKAAVNAGNVDSLNKASLVRQQDEHAAQLVEKTTSDELTTLEDDNMKQPSDELVEETEQPSKLTVVTVDEPIKQSNASLETVSPAKVLVSSTTFDSEINDFADYTSRSVLRGPSVLNSETCMIGAQSKPASLTADNAGNVGGHSQDDLRVSVSEDGIVKESSERMICVERCGDVVLSSLGEIKIHVGEVSLKTKDTHVSSLLDLGFSDGKKNAAAVVGSLEAGSVEPSSDSKVVLLLTGIEKGPQEEFLDGNDSSLSSSEAGRITIVDDLLRVECLSNGDPGAGTFDSSTKISCLNGGTFSPEMSHIKGSVSAGVSIEDDIGITRGDDCLPKVTWEKMTGDVQSVLCTIKTSETEENVFSSLPDQDRTFSCVREGHASLEEELIISGDGNDSRGDRSHEGPSEMELSRQSCSKKDSNSCAGKSPKKKKVSSPRLVKSVSYESAHEGPSGMPIAARLINGVSPTELESQNALSDVDDDPPSCPSTILHESSTAKTLYQAEPSKDGLMDHFSDVPQVNSCNFQLGAAGKETTSSGISAWMLRIAYGVSEDKGSSLGIDQKLAPEDGAFHNYALDKEDMPLLANSLALFSDSNFVPTMEASTEGVESGSHMSPLVSSPEGLPNNSLIEEPTKSSTSNRIVIGKNQNVDENFTSAYASEFGRSSRHKAGGVPVVNISTVSLSSQDTIKSTRNVSSLSWKANLRANQQNSAGPRVSSGRPSPSFITSRNVPIPKKPLTWHRTGNSSSSAIGQGSKMTSLPPQSHLPKDIAKVSSYIRKGNSLVRKPPPVGGSLSQANRAPISSVYRLNSSGVNDLTTKTENRTDITGSPSIRGTSEVNAASERLKTPPQSEPFCCITLKSTSLPVVDHPGNDTIATNSDPLEVTDNFLALKPSDHPSTSSVLPECQIGSRGNFESQNALDEGSSRKKIVYVKQRSNQLVAASDQTQTSSDGYYKRKNQLVRASGTNHVKRKVGTAENIVPFRIGLARTKWSKFSLVWKLGDAQSSRRCCSTLGYEKLWPYLFPWKRASYRRSFLSSSPSDSSMSIIRWKLLLAKKRETIYTRSIHGLSLRRSKVLSVSGSSLKWSKSIEQRSKKAAEEAAQAVAAVGKRKRGQDGFNTHSMIENNVSRERIFRIGSERYKMDPSGKTLQRISGDGEPSVSAVPELKKSYVPKRLSIGNDEYVRVGIGSKLVRNPKRRVRILASEKVRWSLHTARIRLARKKQYCQFFTRFGKCNKDNGKCPYIHDLSKIAVCTKFLNGSCSDTNCKLTHEVIPERMQDCSYFLQGICSNENCSYRHVNVNPNASICEGFLRGYCADGNECRKKHTYVCPVFEATGSCPQGAKCKLHHPKNKRKGVKRKASSDLKNGQGRYFGSRHIDISERITAGSGKASVERDDDIFFKEGKFVDFICIDGSDEDDQTLDQRSEETPMCDGGPAEMQLDDLDELIKPMLLINRDRCRFILPSRYPM